MLNVWSFIYILNEKKMFQQRVKKTVTISAQRKLQARPSGNLKKPPIIYGQIILIDFCILLPFSGHAYFVATPQHTSIFILSIP